MNEVFFSQVKALSDQAFFEFNDISDFVWKSPIFLKYQRESEEKKMMAYFPDGGETARMRWKYESIRLEIVFPYMIATGNLFSVVSIFETYLLRLAQLIEEETGCSFYKTQGQGFAKIRRYFREQKFNPEGPTLFPQVQMIYSVRNCLAHASGLLESNRDRDTIQFAIKSKTYLSAEDRGRHVKLGLHSDELTVEPSQLGLRLSITNGYSHRAVHYLREYFMQLCLEVGRVPPEE